MGKLTRFPTTQMQRWLRAASIALALLAPSYGRAGSSSAAMSVSVEVRRSCAVDTAQVTSVSTSGRDVVVVGGAVELGCSGFASAHVTLSTRDAAPERVGAPELPLLVFEESARATVQAITAELTADDLDRNTVFVNVIF
jgi:hypothetical protein